MLSVALCPRVDKFLSMKEELLLAWIGHADLQASRGEFENAVGPIASAIDDMSCDAVWLAGNYDDATGRSYVEWLRERASCEIVYRHCPLSSPTAFAEIYQAADRVIQEVRERHGDEARLTYHLSPGTPAMASVWIILAKTLRPARLIQTSVQAGLEVVDFPFELAAEYLGKTIDSDEAVTLAQGLPPAAPQFDEIVHRCAAMERAILLARRMAQHDVPVLIQGESGTGKELFTRAIHHSSPRRKGPLVVVNCGAIPESLVESELFGHKKGAFTGATSNRAGYLEQAHGGTLFLDEIGELPLSSQVKLLRVLQEGTLRRLGDEEERRADFRVIAATNRDLLQEIGEGRFREDLFHRIAVGLLRLPPLRERTGDLGLLVDHLMTDIQESLTGNEGEAHKKLSTGAKNVIQHHPWPGNVRELHNTLMRAIIWTPGETITKADMEQAMLPVHCSLPETILHRPISDGIDLDSVLDEVKQHYLTRAHAETHGQKKAAAKLLGFTHYQTYSNWREKLGLDE